ncbi:MAG: hypothetical protein ACKO56_08085 [Paracoccaceae bacterium]
MFQLADVENLIKTRRSLMIASIATLIFASLSIASEKATFLGIEILISQRNIVLVGQACSLYLLIVFLLQALPEFIKMFGWIWDARINSLERQAWNNFGDEWGFHDDDGYQGETYGPDADSNFIKWRFERLRRKKTTWIEMLSITAVMIANFFIAYLSPIIAASLCLFWPNVLAWLLT